MVASNVDVKVTSAYLSGSSNYLDVHHKKMFSKIMKELANTKPVLEEIGRDWFRGNKRKIFSQRGVGEPFADLSAKYKLRKPIPIYPILVAKGDLERSLIDPEDSNALFEILPKSVILGTTIEHAEYLRKGRPDMPVRDPVQVSHEEIERWLQMAAKHVGKVVGDN